MPRLRGTTVAPLLRPERLIIEVVASAPFKKLIKPVDSTSTLSISEPTALKLVQSVATPPEYFSSVAVSQ